MTLDGAAPVIGERTATLKYRNANGGRQVDLDAAPGRSRLDVYVDYGLDVNIEPDLDPESGPHEHRRPLDDAAMPRRTREPVNP